MATATPPPSDARAGGVAGRHYLLGVLTAACLLSFLDRYMLNLLVQPIKAAMALSDTQIGLLIGLAFALLFSIMAVPFGWAVDRYSRRMIVVVGILLWSVATAFCGVASTFGQLMVARTLVGIGEASLMPAAYSMLADAYPAHQRGRAYSIFTVAVFAGSGLALLAGSQFLVLAGVLKAHVASLRDAADWRVVFGMIGLLGVPAALLALRAREPARLVSRAQGSAGSLIRHVGRNRASFAYMFAVYALLGFVVFGVTPWVPTMVIRKFGASTAHAGTVVGICTLFGGLTGGLLAGLLGDRWTAARRRGGKLRLALVWWLGATPMLIAFCLAGTLPAAACFYAVFAVFNSIGYVSASAVLQDMVPGHLRGQATALYYLVTTIGMALGPVVTGAIADHLAGSANALGEAMLTMAVPSMLLGTVLTLLGMPRFDETYARVSHPEGNMAVHG